MHLKNILFRSLITILISTATYAQCTTNPFIQNEYQADLIAFVLREIQSNPNDPNVNDPFVPASRTIPFREKLSAIYENPNNEPIIDEIFNAFEIHANFEIAQPLFYSTIYLGVDFSAPWLNSFLTTGISGNTTLDNLMVGYEMSITSDAPLSNYHWIVIDTNTPGINTPAVIDDFNQVNGIILTEAVAAGVEERLNYTGTTYTINGENVAACDITFDGDLVCFTLYAGFCPTGCLYSESYCLMVNDQCEVGFILNENEFEKDIVKLFPNPVSDHLMVSSLPDSFDNYSIYDSMGRIIVLNQQLVGEQIEVSSLSSGFFIIEFRAPDGRQRISKFLKK